VETLDDKVMKGRISGATAQAHRVEGVAGRGAGGGTATLDPPASRSTGAVSAGDDEVPFGDATAGGSPSGQLAPLDSRADVVRAYAPYAMIIIVFALSQIPAVKSLLENGVTSFAWPGLDVRNSAGEPLTATTFTFNWLPAGGTLVLLSGLLTIPILRLSPAKALRAYVTTYDQLKWAVVTVMAVLGLAYVMNLSGQTITIGQWMAGAGGLFALLSPVLGWLGVAVTGSDTSSNALFANLQKVTAQQIGVNPNLTRSAPTPQAACWGR
jgi:lactate permease